MNLSERIDALLEFDVVGGQFCLDGRENMASEGEQWEEWEEEG